MSDWKSETSLDLNQGKDLLVSVAESLSGEPSPTQIDSVWRAYVRVEKSIVFIRLEIDEENPGRFINAKAYSVPDERQAIQFALRNLSKGIESFSVGDYRQALKELRESRNYLRALLREKRLSKLRKERVRK